MALTSEIALAVVTTRQTEGASERRSSPDAWSKR